MDYLWYFPNSKSPTQVFSNEILIIFQSSYEEHLWTGASAKNVEKLHSFAFDWILSNQRQAVFHSILPEIDWNLVLWRVQGFRGNGIEMEY